MKKSDAILSHLKSLRARGVESVSVDAKAFSDFAVANPTTPKPARTMNPDTPKPTNTATPATARPTRAPEPFSPKAPSDLFKVAEAKKPFNAPKPAAFSPQAPADLFKVAKAAAPKKSAILAAVPTIALPAGDKKKQWDYLRNLVVTDKEVLSHVHPGCVPVFGVGSLDSPILFCGEAPGAEEEQQGIPFVGRAGQLLTKIIEAMGVKRDEVYIANIMNWRPEMEESGNRPPTYEEMAKCLPYLKAQVAIVKPKAIIALGATATTGLLGPDEDRKMGTARGNFFEFAGTPVMVTYHPSYLLRNNTNAAKRVVWEDFMLVMEKVGMPINDKQKKFFL